MGLQAYLDARGAGLPPGIAGCLFIKVAKG
jgi:hypothetical protein